MADEQAGWWKATELEFEAALARARAAADWANQAFAAELEQAATVPVPTVTYRQALAAVALIREATVRDIATALDSISNLLGVVGPLVEEREIEPPCWLEDPSAPVDETDYADSIFPRLDEIGWELPSPSATQPEPTATPAPQPPPSRGGRPKRKKIPEA